MTKNIRQTNQTSLNCSREFRAKEHFSFSTTPLWKNVSTKPDLIVACLLCEQTFNVKYNALKKQYSQKNNWNYWMSKKTDQPKYLCSTCLWKLHVGKMSDWITNESRADVFYNYIKRGQFGKKEF